MHPHPLYGSKSTFVTFLWVKLHDDGLSRALAVASLRQHAWGYSAAIGAGCIETLL